MKKNLAKKSKVDQLRCIVKNSRFQGENNDTNSSLKLRETIDLLDESMMTIFNISAESSKKKFSQKETVRRKRFSFGSKEDLFKRKNN